MDNCVFPEKLKEAEVRAIYKKGDQSQIVNYRSAGNKKSSIIRLRLIVTLTYHFLNMVLIYQVHVIFGWPSYIYSAHGCQTWERCQWSLPGA